MKSKKSTMTEVWFTNVNTGNDGVITKITGPNTRGRQVEFSIKMSWAAWMDLRERMRSEWLEQRKSKIASIKCVDETFNIQ